MDLDVRVLMYKEDFSPYDLGFGICFVNSVSELKSIIINKQKINHKYIKNIRIYVVQQIAYFYCDDENILL